MPASISNAVASHPTVSPTSTLSPVFLRNRDVHRLTGLTRSTLNRMMSENAFPAPCRLGGREVGWRSEDIAQWNAARPVARQ